MAVAALRLAEYSEFVDPELLGWFVYDRSIRHRLPTIFRQTVLQEMSKEPSQTIRKEDVKRIVKSWRLLAKYETVARNAEVDIVLTMLRRAHDKRFLAPEARAGLLINILEATLGRFRSKKRSGAA